MYRPRRRGARAALRTAARPRRPYEGHGNRQSQNVLRNQGGLGSELRLCFCIGATPPSMRVFFLLAVAHAARNGSFEAEHARLAALHGARVALPDAATLEASWPTLFGEKLSLIHI